MLRDNYARLTRRLDIYCEQFHDLICFVGEQLWSANSIVIILRQDVEFRSNGMVPVRLSVESFLVERWWLIQLTDKGIRELLVTSSGSTVKNCRREGTS